jgi:DNA-directed RNA polymerase specialized sigma24 family protein
MESLIETERSVLAQKILSELRPSCLELFRLVVAERLSYAQVAELQGRSAEAVRRHWCDCVKAGSALRARIEGTLTLTTGESA